MKNFKFKIGTNKDAQTIKNLINQMYGVEYEVREYLEIAKAIENKTEIYVLAYYEEKCIGFQALL